MGDREGRGTLRDFCVCRSAPIYTLILRDLNKKCRLTSSQDIKRLLEYLTLLPRLVSLRHNLTNTAPYLIHLAVDYVIFVSEIVCIE